MKIPCTSVLVVPVEAPYKNPADLKGQQIAGLSTTCCAVILIRGTSRNQYDTDFELVTLVPGVAIAVLGAGQVKSAILKEPFVSLTLISKNAQGQLRYKTLEAIAEDGADQLTLSNSMADDIVDIAAKYVTIDRQAIINSNPKLGFTTRLAMEELKVTPMPWFARELSKRTQGTRFSPLNLRA